MDADHYRARAAEFHAKARSERSPGRRSQLEALERDYLRLAAQAELTPTDRAQSGKKHRLRLDSMNRLRAV